MIGFLQKICYSIFCKQLQFPKGSRDIDCQKSILFYSFGKKGQITLFEIKQLACSFSNMHRKVASSNAHY